jgi:RNA polymerase sigma-70 factor (ECF subfamily)
LKELTWFKEIARGGAIGESAFTALYKAYEGPFLKFLRPIGEELARDLVHDCFEKVLRSAQRLDTIRRPRAYLWTMLRNTVIDHHRNRVTALTEDNLAMLAPLLSPHGRSDLEQLDFEQSIACAYTHLLYRHPEKALAIRLAAVEELSGPDLAIRLGRSPAAAREFLSQARKELRSLMNRTCSFQRSRARSTDSSNDDRFSYST